MSLNTVVDMKLQKFSVEYDLRKFYFSNRIVNIWNSLPSHAIRAESVDSFKTRLDKFWNNQDIIYDFRAELYMEPADEVKCLYNLA